MSTYDAESVKKEVRETFHTRIKELREEIGISQAEFAKAMGVSRAAIGYYESGERLPDIAFVRAVSERTGCGLDYLINGSNKMLLTNEHIEAAELDDTQTANLIDLMNYDSFKWLLNDNQFLEICSRIDFFASRGLGHKTNGILSLVVANDSAASFAKLIRDVYNDLDAQALFFDDQYNDEQLNMLSEEEDIALATAFLLFRKAHEKWVNRSNALLVKKHNRMTNNNSGFPKETDDDKDKIEQYREELLRRRIISKEESQHGKETR